MKILSVIKVISKFILLKLKLFLYCYCNSIKDQLEHGCLYKKDKSEINKIKLYSALIFSILWLIKTVLITIISDKQTLIILQDFTLLFGDGKVYVNISVIVWALSNLIVRFIFYFDQSLILEILDNFLNNQNLMNKYLSDEIKVKLSKYKKFIFISSRLAYSTGLIFGILLFIYAMNLNKDFSLFIIIDIPMLLFNICAHYYVCTGLVYGCSFMLVIFANISVYFEMISKKLNSVKNIINPRQFNKKVVIIWLI